MPPHLLAHDDDWSNRIHNVLIPYVTYDSLKKETFAGKACKYNKKCIPDKAFHKDQKPL